MKSGSALVASRKASIASSYQKECSAASPRRKCSCAFADPDVGNSTRPSCDCALTVTANKQTRINDFHIGSPHVLNGFLVDTIQMLTPPAVPVRVANAT